jgi:hypothetical protein
MGLTPQVGPDQFDGDDAVDQDVAGSVDDAHSAFADAGFQSIAPGNHLAESRIVTPSTSNGSRRFLRCRLCHLSNERVARS